jgi:hypothetical protein
MLKHKQYRFIKTSEPGTLNLEPLSLGICHKKDNQGSIHLSGLRPGKVMKKLSVRDSSVNFQR